MALTRTLTLYSGSDASPVVDYTNDTDWPQTELANAASGGEAAAGQWLLRDELGAIPDGLGARYLNGHNVVVCTVGSNTLFRGRIAAAEHFRGRQHAGRASEWSITLEDANSHARGIVVDAWVRPEESDTARMLALVSDYLNGSPRATTVLTTARIISSNTVTLPAKTYTGVTPFEIMTELASNTDKEVFISVDNELFYCGHDYAGYDSAFRISDDLADANSTTFAPIDPRGTESSRNILSALRVYTSSGATNTSTRLTNANAPSFDYWEDLFWDSDSTTAAQSAARTQKMLDYRGLADVSYSCAIGPLTGAQTNELKAGMRISFKARAANGGRLANGTFTGDSFLTTRIREIRWTMPGEDQYIAHLSLERPKRTSPFTPGNQALAVPPAPLPPFVPNSDCGPTDIDTFRGRIVVPDGLGDASSGGTWDMLDFSGSTEVNGSAITVTDYTGAGNMSARLVLPDQIRYFPAEVYITFQCDRDLTAPPPTGGSGSGPVYDYVITPLEVTLDTGASSAAYSAFLRDKAFGDGSGRVTELIFENSSGGLDAVLDTVPGGIAFKNTVLLLHIHLDGDDSWAEVASLGLKTPPLAGTIDPHLPLTEVLLTGPIVNDPPELSNPGTTYNPVTARYNDLYMVANCGPSGGQIVSETLALGDGSTVAFDLTHDARVIRQILVDGVDLTDDATFTPPTTITFDYAPLTDAEIIVEYEAA